MLSFLELLITFFSGYIIIKSLPVLWYRFEFVSISYTTGLLVVTWFSFLCSLLFGYTVGVPLGWLLSMGAASGISLLIHKKLHLLKRAQFTQKRHSIWQLIFQPPKFITLGSSWQRIVFSIFCIGWALVFSTVFAHHSFSIQDDGWYSGSNTWGDLALHSSLIYHFAEKAQPILQFPIFPEAKLTYPFLFDFYTATLLQNGMSIQYSLLITSVVTAMAVVMLCFSACMRITQSFWIGIGSTVLFLSNSNVGIWYAYQDWLGSGSTLWQFLQDIPHNYVHYEEHGLYWAQVVTDLLLPQRGILMGISVFCTAVILLIILAQSSTFFTSATSKNELNNCRTLHADEVSFIRYLFVFLLGMLPLFHIHSFLVICGVWAWYLLMNLVTHTQSFKQLLAEWMKPGLLLVCLVLPQLLWQFTGTSTSSFVSFKPGWLNTEGSLLIFWIKNLGIQLLTTLIGIYYVFLIKRDAKFLQNILTPLLLLFILCNLYLFQPSAWDNTKFMLYSHWAMACLTALVLHAFWKWGSRQSKQLKTLTISTVVFIFVLQLSGGIISIAREYQLDWQIITSEELAAAAWVRENTPPDAVFLTANNHNHPVPMLTGRTIVMGYPGWLWTYGINYTEKERAVKNMYAEVGGIELLSKNNVSYIYVGNQELKEYHFSPTKFHQYKIVYSSDTITIYQVK